MGQRKGLSPCTSVGTQWELIFLWLYAPPLKGNNRLTWLFAIQEAACQKDFVPVLWPIHHLTWYFGSGWLPSPSSSLLSLIFLHTPRFSPAFPTAPSESPLLILFSLLPSEDPGVVGSLFNLYIHALGDFIWSHGYKDLLDSDDCEIYICSSDLSLRPRFEHPIIYLINLQ